MLEHIQAFIPFLFLFCSFVFFRFPLNRAAFFSLLVSLVIVETKTGLSSALLLPVTTQTLRFCFEIGFILLGAFFFLETAERTGVLGSLVKWIESVSTSRFVQAMMICFPFALMIEGSSGFGTPILLVAPFLHVLRYPLALTAKLTFLCTLVGVPFGALGTPVRLGFQDLSFIPSLPLHLIPLVIFCPWLCAFFIHQHHRLSRKDFIWLLSLQLVFFIPYWALAQVGPEFSALGGGLTALVYGAMSAPQKKKELLDQTLNTFFRRTEGLLIYTALLAVMALGKWIFKDQKIPLLEVRWFNPGSVFILFAAGLTYFKRQSTKEAFTSAFQRSARALSVLISMTLIVQLLLQTGLLSEFFTHGPEFLRQKGALFTGWIVTSWVGTSTIGNMMLSPVIPSSEHALLAIGTAIGVMAAFQPMITLSAALKGALPEREAFKILTPLSLLIVVVFYFIHTWLY